MDCYRFYKSEGMFESISRTVTCTEELSALTYVIPRGEGRNTPPVEIIIYGTAHLDSIVQLSTLSVYLVSVRYLVPDVLDAHDE